MENRIVEKHEFQKLIYVVKKSRTCLGPSNMLKIVKTWNAGVPDETCTEYIWLSWGVNINKVFMFWKFIFTQGIFWGSTSFGMWHFATVVLFSQYINGMSSLHCQGSMILSLQPLKMKVVCSWCRVGWWAAESENYNSVSYCCAGRSCNSVRYWELRFGSETFMVGHQNTQRKGKGIEEWRELRF